MAEYDTEENAADHPVQVFQPAELGRGGCADGEEVYSRQRKNGISEIYERKLMFVTNVTHVTFQSAIV